MEQYISNPFLSLITSTKIYCHGRLRLLQSITDLVSRPEPVVINLTGPRWIGKSTVLRCLSSAKELPDAVLHQAVHAIPWQNLCFVYVDLISEEAAQDPLRVIAGCLYRTLAAHPQVDLRSVAADISLGTDPETVAPDVVEKRIARLPAAAEAQGVRVVLCLDHVDKSKLFGDATLMRRIEPATNAASLVMASRRTLTDLYPGLAGSPLIHRSLVLKVGLLSEQAAIELLSQKPPMEESLFSRADMELLITFAGRHPYALLRAAYQAYELLLDAPHKRKIGLSINDIRAEIEPALRPVFEGLWQEHGDQLTLFHRFEIEKSLEMSETEKRAIRQELQRAALIYEEAEEEWKFNYFSPLFESFVVSKLHVTDQSTLLPKEGLPVWSEIRENLELRDGTHEAEVLALLVRNRGEIFTDDYLVDEVWGQEGTRRALLTTIGRLRKKMKESEEDIGGQIVRHRGEGFSFE